ncbi:MAG: hypothetical protein ABIH38_05005 [Patescibacteria group bacterium]
MRQNALSSKAKPLWQKGASDRVISRKIDGFVKGNIRYGQDRILGFPGTTPDMAAVEVYTRHLSSHPNNIGMHTNSVGRKSEVGFSGTQEAERQVISMAADLLNGRSDEIDGYISSGGTEANIVGC